MYAYYYDITQQTTIHPLLLLAYDTEYLLKVLQQFYSSEMNYKVYEKTWTKYGVK
jgi:hypothetical protein